MSATGSLRVVCGDSWLTVLLYVRSFCELLDFWPRLLGRRRVGLRDARERGGALLLRKSR